MPPKRKPLALERLEGNPGKRKKMIEIPMPLELPDAPKHLDTYAREEWDRIAAGLFSVGMLCRADMGALAAYCSAFSLWRQAEEELGKIRESGGQLNALILKTISGNYIQQPLIGIANKAKADMVRYAAEFGMTPSARARLAIDPGKGQKSKFEGLINGKK
jgi:P27 family predicted phage terminase small subunit